MFAYYRMAPPTFHPRKFYCANQIGPACRKGFSSRGGYTQHQNAVHHKLSSMRMRPRQHPPPQTCHGIDSDSDSDSVSSGDTEPQPIGAYYEVHPVLDGKY